MSNIISNDHVSILAQAIDEMKAELGNRFSLETINLAELSRRTGYSRKKLRLLKANGFVEKKRQRSKSHITVLTGYTGIIDNYLRRGVSNSVIIYERLIDNGYKGKLTQVKNYIQNHKDLLPPKRQLVALQGNRGRRYTTGPGESYQMDWGFVNVKSYYGSDFQVACFAMICHHCGKRYIEFFPNAKQENLFIGMVHTFLYMEMPKSVLTDNMKSVVIRRDADSKPIWNHEYEEFMKTIGFETRLCKPRHPFTKGAVERLVRFVKDNFIAGRIFNNISDLNEAAIEWCDKSNAKYHNALDCVPSDKHFTDCMNNTKQLDKTKEVAYYLCPIRTISFDGFVNYEGRRFGVPFSYKKQFCRVKRDKDTLYIYDLDLNNAIVTHPITWSRKDSYCKDQYSLLQPEEHPSMPIKVELKQIQPPSYKLGFEKFNFEEDEQ